MKPDKDHAQSRNSKLRPWWNVVSGHSHFLLQSKTKQAKRQQHNKRKLVPKQIKAKEKEKISPKQILRTSLQELSLCFAETAAWPALLQTSCTKPPLILLPNRVEKHESKCKYFRALTLNLQTWQKITYGQSYHKHDAAVLNPAGLLYHNRMRLSSSSHPKNKVISCLEDNKLEGVMFKDFSLINSHRCCYPLPLALLLVFFRHTLI